MHLGAYLNAWNTHWDVPFFGIVLWPIVGVFVLVAVVWSFYWKGRALWHAAKKDSLWWFIAILTINTAGILEILYIYNFSKKSK